MAAMISIEVRYYSLAEMENRAFGDSDGIRNRKLGGFGLVMIEPPAMDPVEEPGTLNLRIVWVVQMQFLIAFV